jgi:hypothetical protein
VFALQDSALMALRQARWLPIENGLTAVVRLVALPVAATFAGTSGILVSWTLPIIPAIAIVNVALFRRLLNPGRLPIPQPHRVIRYGLTDLPGLTLTFVSLRLVPLFVVELEGSDVGAYIGVPWSILVVAALALPAVSQLALAEMAHAGEDAEAVLRRLVRFVMMIFVPGAVLGSVLAPTILSVAGSRYASHGGAVLVWGIIGLIPAALLECDLAAMRFEGLMVRTTMIQSARAVVLMAGIAVVTTQGHADLVGAVFTAANLATLIVAHALRPRHLHRP